MTSLNDLLYVILKDSAIKIYIQDLSGIFSNPLCEVDLKNKSYSSPMYDFFGKNNKCLSCREQSLNSALNSSAPFIRKCPCGMSEAVCPVILDGKIKCILYAENISDQSQESTDALNSFCEEAYDFSSAKVILDNCSPQSDVLKILEVISSYIILLLNNFSFAETKSEEYGTHWVVENLKKHIENEYFKDINLKQMASLYDFNEKYLGRIFKAETGVTFHEYLNSVRLEAASLLLTDSEESVVKISKKCGFNNVTYFNRIFFKRFEKTPLEYRNSKSNRFWDKHSYLL
ncbi:MAG: helix-turn-helix domain-containing protein [Clostridia bacterium]|nr:helix-turn-helix domain-containing protein [Clostridia bacterium]